MRRALTGKHRLKEVRQTALAADRDTTYDIAGGLQTLSRCPRHMSRVQLDRRERTEGHPSHRLQSGDREPRQSQEEHLGRRLGKRKGITPEDRAPRVLSRLPTPLLRSHFAQWPQLEMVKKIPFQLHHQRVAANQLHQRNTLDCINRRQQRGGRRRKPGGIDQSGTPLAPLGQ